MSERVTAKRSGERAIVPLLQGGLASHPEEAVGPRHQGEDSVVCSQLGRKDNLVLEKKGQS